MWFELANVGSVAVVCETCATIWGDSMHGAAACQRICLIEMALWCLHVLCSCQLDKYW